MSCHNFNGFKLYNIANLKKINNCGLFLKKKLRYLQKILTS